MLSFYKQYISPFSLCYYSGGSQECNHNKRASELQTIEIITPCHCLLKFNSEVIITNCKANKNFSPQKQFIQYNSRDVVINPIHLRETNLFLSATHPPIPPTPPKNFYWRIKPMQNQITSNYLNTTSLTFYHENNCTN